MSVTIIRANALDLPLADASADLIVTSPPYFGLRSYRDGGKHYLGQIGAEATPAGFVDALIAATREMMRVLKPSGSIWINLGDRYSTGSSGQSGLLKLGEQYRGGGHTQGKAKTRTGRVAGMRPKSLIGIPWRYALRCIDELGLILRAEVIWGKPNATPESVTDRVRRMHEQWFHFTNQDCYFSTLDEIREPYAPGTAARYAASHPLGRLSGSVWMIATQPLKLPPELNVEHYAAFPMELPRRIIAAWSPAGGVVLDPFGGTGTAALVADVMGRDAISVDLSADYCRAAQWRTSDLKQRARAACRPVKQRAAARQLSLFEDGEI